MLFETQAHAHTKKLLYRLCTMYNVHSENGYDNTFIPPHRVYFYEYTTDWDFDLQKENQTQLTG